MTEEGMVALFYVLYITGCIPLINAAVIPINSNSCKQGTDGFKAAQEPQAGR